MPLIEPNPVDTRAHSLAFTVLPWWACAASVIGWALFLGCVRSYLSLVRTALSMSWRRTFSLWFGGLWRFFIWYYLLLLWFLPLAFNLIYSK
jgi:hypothetical protein